MAGVSERPKRVQRSRRAGWRMPAGAVYVGRPSKWGNPYRVGESRMHVNGFNLSVPNAATAVRFYRDWIERSLAAYPDLLDALRGRDLVCWCPLDAPCHADVLLELANPDPPDA